MILLNSSGPRRLPCETPEVTWAHCEAAPSAPTRTLDPPTQVVFEPELDQGYSGSHQPKSHLGHIPFIRAKNGSQAGIFSCFHVLSIVLTYKPNSLFHFCQPVLA